MKIAAGQRFDRLVTVSNIGRAADGHRVWMCACDCGKTVQRQTNTLKTSGIKSCGCVQVDLQTKHGMRWSREYSSWQSAKARCCNPTSKDYPNYGGRGIKMCDQWIASFEAFHAHMGDRPDGTTLERENVNGDYEPGNCKWATDTEQARNKRRSAFAQWRGRRTHLCDIAEELGITYGAAFMRQQRGTLHDSP